MAADGTAGTGFSARSGGGGGVASVGPRPFCSTMTNSTIGVLSIPSCTSRPARSTTISSAASTPACRANDAIAARPRACLDRTSRSAINAGSRPIHSTSTPCCFALASGSTWMVISRWFISAFNVASIRSQMACESATVIAPGTTR